MAHRHAERGLLVQCWPAVKHVQQASGAHDAPIQVCQHPEPGQQLLCGLKEPTGKTSSHDVDDTTPASQRVPVHSRHQALRCYLKQLLWVLQHTLKGKCDLEAAEMHSIKSQLTVESCLVPAGQVRM